MVKATTWECGSHPCTVSAGTYQQHLCHGSGVTSALETNVASVSSFLGLPVKVLTTFEQGPIAQLDQDNLGQQAYGV